MLLAAALSLAIPALEAPEPTPVHEEPSPALRLVLEGLAGAAVGAGVAAGGVALSFEVYTTDVDVSFCGLACGVTVGATAVASMTLPPLAIHAVGSAFGVRRSYGAAVGGQILGLVAGGLLSIAAASAGAPEAGIPSLLVLPVGTSILVAELTGTPRDPVRR